MDKDKACERYEEMLALYRYDELGPGEAAEVQKHLASCGACQAAMEGLDRMLGGLPDYEPTAGEVRSAVEGVVQKITVRRRPFAGKLVPAAAAAAALALVLVYFSHKGPGPLVGKAPPEQLMMAGVDMELLANFELLENMDLLEDMELIEMLEELGPAEEM